MVLVKKNQGHVCSTAKDALPKEEKLQTAWRCYGSGIGILLQLICCYLLVMYNLVCIYGKNQCCMQSRVVILIKWNQTWLYIALKLLRFALVTKAADGTFQTLHAWKHAWPMF